MLLKQSATDWVIDKEEKLMSRRDIKIRVLASNEELLAGGTRKQKSPLEWC